MKTAPKQRRTFGDYCESRVDHWLVELGWEPIVKNLRYPGGEIDRIYQRSNASPHFCLVEVKGMLVSSMKECHSLLWEWGLRRFIKPRQLQRLLKVYTHWQAQHAQFRRHDSRPARYHFRLMIVLVFRDCQPDAHTQNQLERQGYRYIRVGKNTAIVSMMPDLTPRNMRHTSLQIEH